MTTEERRGAVDYNNNVMKPMALVLLIITKKRHKTAQKTVKPTVKIKRIKDTGKRPDVNRKHAQCEHAYKCQAGESMPTAGPHYLDNSMHNNRPGKHTCVTMTTPNHIIIVVVTIIKTIFC